MVGLGFGFVAGLYLNYRQVAVAEKPTTVPPGKLRPIWAKSKFTRSRMFSTQNTGFQKTRSRAKFSPCRADRLLGGEVHEEPAGHADERRGSTSDVPGDGFGLASADPGRLPAAPSRRDVHPGCRHEGVEHGDLMRPSEQNSCVCLKCPDRVSAFLDNPSRTSPSPDGRFT